MEGEKRKREEMERKSNPKKEVCQPVVVVAMRLYYHGTAVILQHTLTFQ